MRRIGLASLLLLVTFSTSACYLTHIAAGQVRLLRGRQPIDEVLRDPTTSPELRDRLLLVARARAFARELGLDVGGQYTSFVPWPGDRVVTALVATRPGEVVPAGFRYPLIGSLPYKGFFDEERAEAEARRLRGDGLDVCVAGVSAYSTLGWLDDPVTAPMLRRPDGVIVETIVHELVHATVYLRGDAEFNEGIASFVGEEGAVRFYRENGEPDRAASERARIEDERRVMAALLRFRERVAALGESLPAGAPRDAARRQLEEAFRGELAALELGSLDAAQVADSLRLNNACLAWYGTYHADVPRYRAALERLGGDLALFVARLRAAADSDDPRSALLDP